MNFLTAWLLLVGGLFIGRSGMAVAQADTTKITSLVDLIEVMPELLSGVPVAGRFVTQLR
jgi:hypothetical protein